jgi:hypothetical protein
LKKLLVLLSPLSLVFAQPPSAGVASPANTIQTQVFPRIIANRNWETTFVLVNRGATSVSFHQYFLGANGTPQEFTLRNQSDGTVLTTSELTGKLTPNSSLSLVLTDSGESVREGWSFLSYDGSQGKVGGYAILRHRGLSGGFSFETTLPLNDMQDFSLCMPFDNTLGFRTQLTLVNPASNVPAQVNLTYRTAAGQLLLLDSLNLQPAQQMTISLPDVYPDLANQTGNIAIEANINRLSVSGLRYNTVYGAIASIPGIN